MRMLSCKLNVNNLQGYLTINEKSHRIAVAEREVRIRGYIKVVFQQRKLTVCFC
jgi:hypothetical protein